MTYGNYFDNTDESSTKDMMLDARIRHYREITERETVSRLILLKAGKRKILLWIAVGKSSLKFFK